MTKIYNSTNELIPIAKISRLRAGTDGKGMRTLIVVSGCPLDCKYCINSSAKNSEFGMKYSAEELYEAIKIDNLYFLATNGGLTFGGGEPAVYASFISKFVKKYAAEWNNTIETSLNVERKNIDLLSKVMNHFYIDIKSLNEEIYYKYTGGKLQVVEENLRYLITEVGTERVTVRVPLIPNYSTEDDCRITMDKIRKMGINSIDYFKYVEK